MKRIVGSAICVILMFVISFSSFGISTPATSTQKGITVTIGWGSPNGMDQDEMGKYVQKKFNMKIKYLPTRINSDNVNVMTESGNLPEVFSVSLTDPVFHNLKKAGLIREIPQKILNKFELLKKYADLNICANAYKKTVGGKNYLIPKLNNSSYASKSNGMYIVYRADWLKKLGLKAPATVNELYTMLRAFTVGDPDGNGKLDTYGISGWVSASNFIPWINYNDWIKEGGKWIPGYVSDRMKPALTYYNKLYKDKILDPDFAQLNSKDNFFNGRVGFYVLNSSDYWLNADEKKFSEANPGLKYKNAVKILPPLKLNDKSKASWVPSVEDNCIVFTKKCTDEMLTRVLTMFEWELSSEGSMFINYGFKDKDYSVKDGKAISLLPKDSYGNQQVLWQKYPSVNIFNLLVWKVNPQVPPANPSIPKEYTDLSLKIDKDIYGPYCTQINYPIAFLYAQSKQKFNISFSEIETQIQKMIASDNAVAEFEKYRTTLLKDNNLQKVIDEVNKLVK